MIILRTDDEIYAVGAADNLLALGLRDTAGDRDQHLAAVRLRRVLQLAHAADFRIELVDRLLTDVAGVENDEVGVGRARGLDIALGRQRVRHTIGIVDVHLAAEGFDVDFARTVHAVSWELIGHTSLSWPGLSLPVISLISLVFQGEPPCTGRGRPSRVALVRARTASSTCLARTFRLVDASAAIGSP